MIPSHLLLLFAMLHHTHKSTQPTKKDVAAFVVKAESVLHQYKTGDVFEWLEADYIENIEQDIDYLRRNPKSKDALEMEQRIVDEVSALHDYDDQIQTDLANSVTTVRQG